MGPVWFRFQRSDDGINWTNVGSSRAENIWAANQLRSYFPEAEKPFSFQIVANRSSYGPSRLYFEKARME